ncbi:DoxX family protein [Nocardia sp. NPDC127526]|uniref:DoxX family protein n=1 Tax=Nocardia sp. NPDC127526 TaxID=3345393 RepID=UPI00363B6958
MRRWQWVSIRGWAYTAIRVVLSLLMIAFGMVKVIPTQFIAFTLPSEMLVPLGESSPSGMLWKFMATSTPYTVISGVVEVLGGLLLIARRTVLLGALVSMVALIQVSILNICYDVPVVLTPLLMLGMALVVSMPWWSRLIDVMIRNRDSPALPRTPLVADPRLRRAGVAAHAAAALLVLIALGANGINQYRDYTDRLSELDGVWAVDGFRGDGPRWVRLAIDDRPASQRVVLLRDNGELLELDLVVEEPESQIRVGDSTLSYTQPTPDTLRLAGPFDGAAAEVDLYRLPLRSETRTFR